MALVFVVGFFLVPADGGGVEDNFCAAHGGESCCFWEPLVPADEHAGGGVSCVLDGEAVEPVLVIASGVTGGEVIFFVEPWIVGDVHLAVLADDLAGVVDHDGGVVVDAWGAFFEDAGGDFYVEFFGERAECVCG